VTLDQERFSRFQPDLAATIDALPSGTAPPAVWARSVDRTPEGLTLTGKVNYVGKGGRLYDLGFKEHGSASVVSKYLRASWLWEKVRVEGGAYGGFCAFDAMTGQFNFISYRDPNLLGTLATYDASGPFLQKLALSDAELTRSVIGAISDLDAHQLPDARGYSAFVRTLVGETDTIRQRRRDEVLGTTQADFRSLGDVLVRLAETADVVVMGSPEAIEKANVERPGWLRVTKVL
jgi:presequence protease